MIIDSATGTGNTTAPVGDQGWIYVGSINKGSVTSSVTYVGNNWFLTANHIRQLDNPTSINFNGGTYSIEEWSSQLSSGGNNADLVMFRVDGSIPLANVTLHSGSISSGANVTMIGNGRNRAASGTTWYFDIDTDPFDWRETSFTDADFTVDGYKWASGSSKRWGTNEVSSTGHLVNTGFGITESYRTTFDNGAGDNEAQGATYDSGGGVFVENGSDWELAGIMVAVGGYTDQPGSTSMYGNITHIADLSFYQSEIESIILVPEISTVFLTSIALFSCIYIGRRKH